MRRNWGVRAQSAALRHSLWLRSDEEDAAMALVTVLPADQEFINLATAEVERRRLLFEARNRVSPRAIAGTPKACALRSVTHDVLCGYLT